MVVCEHTIYKFYITYLSIKKVFLYFKGVFFSTVNIYPKVLYSFVRTGDNNII